MLIADEPTTGLDVTTQKAVMDLVVELTRERGMSTILITHDLGLAAAYCDRVMVMEKGRVVETAKSANHLQEARRIAYTRKLMRATPRPGVSLRDLLPEDDGGAPGRSRQTRRSAARRRSRLLVVEKLVKEYPRKGVPASLAKLFGRKPPVETETFRAVDGISFSIARGESVGLVGESGCGKSTTSMMVMRLIDQTSGRITFDGEDIGDIPPAAFARFAAAQEHPDGLSGSDRQPQSALYRGARDRRSAAAARQHRGRDALRARCEELADTGRPAAQSARSLSASVFRRTEGARRHCARDRAQPELVILDEPTAALDVSVQAVVLNLLQDLKIRWA